jgi:hypothetical protein
MVPNSSANGCWLVGSLLQCNAASLMPICHVRVVDTVFGGLAKHWSAVGQMQLMKDGGRIRWLLPEPVIGLKKLPNIQIVIITWQL